MKARFTDFVLQSGSTLKTALIQMTSSHLGILLIVDRDFKLLGILSDGDMRRALINDVSLSIPVEQIMNINPVIAKSEQQAVELLESKPYLLLVPVLDDSGTIAGVMSGIKDVAYFKNTELIFNRTSTTENEIQDVKCLAIIPARGGSKRIPQKNLSKIGNHSLLSLAIKVAKQSKHIDHIIVSTDNEEIASEAKSHGIETPWLRPIDLASDNAKSVDVMIHATEKFKEQFGYFPGIILLLEPTAPLRTAELIDQAIEWFNKNNAADSLVSANAIRHNFHPEELLREGPKNFLSPYIESRNFDTRKPRLEQEKLFVQNGLVYIVKSEVLLYKRSLYGEKVLLFENSPGLFCDIDEIEDLKMAEIKLRINN
jgi:CMP-N,N'-diacetyllegionaminic acid synthase